MPSDELTDLQRAVIQHDDDMARLDRNTMPTSETTITVEDLDKIVASRSASRLRRCHRCGREIDISEGRALARPFVMFVYCAECFEIEVNIDD